MLRKYTTYVNTHVNQLMKVRIVEEENVSKLRNFLDAVESHVLVLSNQGVNKKNILEQF